jgi:ribokinase
MNPRIVIVGSLNMDLVVRCPHIPQPGETVIGGELNSIPGGKGANQAVAAARLGAQVDMVGRLGNDSFADRLLENLESAGVSTDHVRRDVEVATGVALIVVDDQGENSIVVASGANMRMTTKDIASAKEAISTADVLLLQLEVPLDVVTRAAQIAKDHQVTVILNPAPAKPLPDELLKLVDVLVPNESETALLTGLVTDSQAELTKAAGELLNFGINSVVITLGGRGAMLAKPDRQEVYEAFNVQPVDTTAAGDAFSASLAVAIGRGESLPNAIRWANSAGALTTLRFGAQTSLPSQDEVARLLRGESPDTIVGRN